MTEPTTDEDRAGLRALLEAASDVTLLILDTAEVTGRPVDAEVISQHVPALYLDAITALGRDAAGKARTIVGKRRLGLELAANTSAVTAALNVPLILSVAVQVALLGQLAEATGKEPAELLRDVLDQYAGEVR